MVGASSERYRRLPLWRARLLRPTIAVLLIDTPALSLDGRIRRLNMHLADDHEEPLAALFSAGGLYWGARHICYDR